MELCGSVKSVPEQLYISMTLYNQILYIAPYEGNSICVYDINKKQPRSKKYTTDQVKKRKRRFTIRQKNK